jgi:quinol monooxygenase YgiN
VDGAEDRKSRMRKPRTRAGLAAVALAALMMAHRERCLKSESGTLQIEVLRPRDDDSRVLFYEVYSDDAAFKVHWEGPFVARVQAETKDMIIKLSGTRCSLQE